MRTRYSVILLALTFQQLYAQNIGVNVADPQYPMHIRQHDTATIQNGDPILFVEYAGTEVNAIAIKSRSVPFDGYGIGGYFEGGGVGVAGVVDGNGDASYAGIYGVVNGTGTGTFIGAYGSAQGTGDNYGLVASAGGGTKNIAGWFTEGDVVVEDRFGIGTETPAFAIDIVKPQAVTRLKTETSLNGSVLELRNTTPSPTFFGAINFGTDVTTPGQIGYLATQHLTFRAGGLERMRIGLNQIGFFHTSPQYPVHIVQPSGTTLIENQAIVHIEYTGTNSDDAIGLRAKCKPQDYYGIGAEFEGGYIGARGKVNGIGGSGFQYFGLRGEATGSGGTKYGVYGVASGSGTNWAGYFEGTVYSTKIGIGRTPATNELEVEGNASKMSAGDWIANSDARLKKNIESLDPEEMITKLLSLQGITYEWNDDKTGSKRPDGMQYGFTAQNINEVFPTLVQEDALGYLQTSYGTYDAMIIEAIRYLYNENQLLKAEINALHETVSR